MVNDGCAVRAILYLPRCQSLNKAIDSARCGHGKVIFNGADIMKPGIVSADPEIAVGDLVVIVEERHNKPLAIGRALVAGTEMKGEGKAVKSLHHVGDAIWKGLEE